MVALNLPTPPLQVGIDGREAGSQPLVSGDEKDHGVLSGERLDIINRGERATERSVLDQSGCGQIVHCPKRAGKRQTPA
jgi:hypothetical protein